jgi:hypothetical protein
MEININKLKSRLYIKLDPINEFTKLGKINLSEVNYLKELIDYNYNVNLSLKDNLILLSASG